MDQSSVVPRKKSQLRSQYRRFTAGQFPLRQERHIYSKTPTNFFPLQRIGMSSLDGQTSRSAGAQQCRFGRDFYKHSAPDSADREPKTEAVQQPNYT